MECQVCDICGEECWTEEDGIVDDDGNRVCYACLYDSEIGHYAPIEYYE